MFENFNSPAIFIAIQGVLSLYAYGLVTGVVVDSGADVTQIVPTSEGNPIPNATCLDIGGQDLNRYLMKILTESGNIFSHKNYIDEVCEMKENFCYVASNFAQEMRKTAKHLDLERTYKLPDDQVITIKNERFQCPEALFQPSFLGKEFDGIHKSCYDNIAKCDNVALRKYLFANIVLSGGTTMFPGFPERMQKEIKALAPDSTKVNIMVVPNRKHNVWIGGSIIASQSVFQNMWLTKQDYEEHGPSIVHKKCV